MLKNLKTFFHSLKKQNKILFTLALSLFFLQGLLFTLKQKNEPYMPTDGTSEQITIFAAKHFMEHGFFEHYLLPTYPPFSVDLNGKPRTEPFVYNHYLAGQDLVLGLWIKVFGENHLGWARLIPHTLTTLGIVLFSLSFGSVFASQALCILMLLGLFVPRSLVAWSTCLWGHPHATAFILIGLAFFLHFSILQNNKYKLFITGLLSAIGVSFFAIDQLPLLCFCFLALSLIQKKSLSLVSGITACIGSVFGFFMAMSYQVFISTLNSHSFKNTISEFKSWLSVRSELVPQNLARFSESYIDHPLNRVLSELNRQAYGATGFTFLNLFTLGLVFIAMGYFSKFKDKTQSLKLILALFFGYLSSVSWTIAMKHHALSNMHFITRHCFGMYLICLCVCLPLALGVTIKASHAKKI